MASLDVEFLFTNILLDETIKNAVDDLFSNNIYQGKVSKSDLYCLLKLVTSESSLIFDNILYKQIDGAWVRLISTLANAIITKNFGSIIVHQNLKLLYTEDMLTTYFCLSQKVICYCSLEYVNTRQKF